MGRDVESMDENIPTQQNVNYKPSLVAHAYNLNIWEAETGGSGFIASLSYLVRPSAT